VDVCGSGAAASNGACLAWFGNTGPVTGRKESVCRRIWIPDSGPHEHQHV